MTQYSLAYIFHEQQLLVDDHFNLPQVEKLEDDLSIQAGDKIIARDLKPNESVPIGFSFVPIRQLIIQWNNEQFEQASRAMQLLAWRRNHKFCSHCGTKTNIHPTEYCMVCPQCNYQQYPRINPCIITIITNDNQEVLLAQSARHQGNMFSLIAGFVEVGETLEQAVAREAFEEIGLQLKNIRYLGSQPWPFPSNLMLAFHAEYAGGEITLQEEEIRAAAFFSYDQLPELPSSGSIAYKMIMHITQQKAL
ncbi:NAD(+) diphosphatase [Acinetobacter sp. MD2]|uniref:NAD(+) diphosphatase n=1 Tax=Acinetobacter sp. MD2 TaxID=2600066 RepID=UPI002D1EBF1F|nr:NAD(+) diphosphatase [Acinetobacter sp. MD2]MEB3767924.1 NAD(+) diphosphatase [Acinetobacter sp. MD2]